MAQLAILPDEVIANTTFKTLSYFLYFLTNYNPQNEMFSHFGTKR